MGYGYFPYVQGGLTPVIYDGSGQQLIALSHATNMTTLVGAEATGDDLRIQANSTDNYSRITLLGGGSMALVGQGGIVLYEQATKMAETSYASNVTTIEGGSVTGDDLILKANATDAYPYIILGGNLNAAIYTKSLIQFFRETTQFFQFGYNAGTDVFINSNVTGIDFRLITTGTGVLQFGTYTAGAATDSTGYITIKDAGGTTRKLMVQA